MTGEAAAFRAFKETPSPDTLVGLLRAHQERIFRLCYQVLHNAADAEDAAQEALLKIPGELRRFADPDSFRRWLYRVSLNAALEGARKAARRHAHETRAAMEKSAPRPLDAATRLALFEALAALDERPRNLVLEHYFEGESLESIGKREGFSAPAVCKKLDEARESLRRRLGGAGAMAALPNLEALFPATPAAPDLVTGAVLAKIAAIAGGAAMTSKSIVLPVAIAVALLLSLGVGIVAMTVRLPETTGPANPRSDPAHQVDAGAAVPLDLPKETMAAEDEGSGADADPDRRSPLLERLDRFKKWWFAIQEDRTLARADGEKWGEFQKRWDKELWEHVSGLKDLILEDPERFLEFLRDLDNDSLVGDLTRHYLLQQTDRPMVYRGMPYREYPSVLMNGLLELLQSGTVSQRAAALNLVGGMDDVPEPFKNVYLTLLDDPSEELRRRGVALVTHKIPMTPALFSKVAAMGIDADSLFMRLTVVSSIASLPSPEAETFVLNRLTAATHQNEIMQISFSLDYRYQAARRAGKAIPEDQLSRALVEFIARNDPWYVHVIMPVATHLSGAHLKTVLQQAMGKAQEGNRDRLAKAVERIDQGPITREELMKILEPSYR